MSCGDFSVLSLLPLLLLLVVPLCSAYRFCIDSTFHLQNCDGYYPSVQSIVTSAHFVNGSQIVMFDGSYAGPGFCNITFPLVHDLTILGNTEVNCNEDSPGWTFTPASSRIYISGVSFAWCYSTRNGAALSLTGVSNVTITDAFFGFSTSRVPLNCINDEECYDLSDVGIGGALAITGSVNVSVRSCQFLLNYASSDNFYGYSGNGGGIGISKSQHILVSDCTFVGNMADNWAGGVSMGFSLDVRIEGCRFLKNVAGWQGGAVVAFGGTSFSITGSDFIENSVGPQSAVGEGGAIFLRDPMPSSIEKCTFINNVAQAVSGAISFRQSSGPDTETGLSVTDSVFHNNQASAFGAACSLFASSQFTRCSFTNHTVANVGGSLYIAGSSTILINCNFSGNSATQYGGSISVNGWASNLYMFGTVIISNSVSGSFGGGLYLDTGAFVSASSGCTINVWNNSAFDSGGGVFVNTYGGLSVTGTMSFVGNTAVNEGGGLFLGTQASFEVYGTTIFDSNSALSGGGLQHNQAYLPALSAGTGNGQMIFTRNVAGFGGAISLNHLGGLTMSGVSNISLVENNALGIGGAMFLFSDLFNLTSIIPENLAVLIGTTEVFVSGNTARHTVNQLPAAFGSGPFQILPCSSDVVGTILGPFNHGRPSTFQVCVADAFAKVLVFAPEGSMLLQIEEGGSSFPSPVVASCVNGVSYFSGVQLYSSNSSSNDILVRFTYQIQQESALNLVIMIQSATFPVQILPCPPGFMSQNVSGIDVCSSCPQGTYNLQPSSPSCFSCPDASLASCSPSKILTESNVWLLEDGSGPVSLYTCPLGYCKDDNQCFSNRDPKSPLCSSCLPGYSEWNLECIRCSETGNGVIIFSVIIGLWACIAIFHFVCRSAIGMTSIFFYYTVTCSMVLPPLGSSDLRIQSVFSLQPFSFGPDTCPFSRDGIGLYLTRLFYPAVLFGLILMTAFVHFLSFRLFKSMDFNMWQYLRSAFVLALSVQQSLSIVMFDFLNVVDVGTWKIVYGFPFIDASSHRYTSLAAFTIFVLILVSAGIPFVVLILCAIHKRRPFLKGSALYALFEGFRPDQPFGPFFFIMRRVSVPALNFFMTIRYRYHSSSRVAAIMFLNVCFLFSHERLTPYASEFLNVVDAGSLLGVCFVCMSVLFYEDSGSVYLTAAVFWSIFAIFAILLFMSFVWKSATVARRFRFFQRVFQKPPTNLNVPAEMTRINHGPDSFLDPLLSKTGVSSSSSTSSLL
eukprot:ANDGO_08606.mRNA.1 hypothetical protein AMSG_11742